MPNIEKIAYPVTIAAAVIGLWVALKGKSPAGAVTETVTNPMPPVGTVSPIDQYLAAPAQLEPSPTVFYEALANPFNPAPGTGSVNAQTNIAPPYLNYNVTGVLTVGEQPPTTQAVVSAAKKSGGCGCGGSCGGAKKSCNTDCVTPCDTFNTRYPDGRGGCMLSQAPVKPSLATIPTLQSYLDKDPYFAMAYAGY